MENGEDKFYYSSQHENNTTLFLNQSHELMEKFRKIRLSKEQDPNRRTFSTCFSQSERDMMKINKANVFVELIVNQTGQIVSAAVLNHKKNDYSLSDNSVNCLLSTALNQTFSYEYLPTDLPENYLLRIGIAL